MVQIPRIVVAGVSSGVGKTTVCVALTAALRARGLRVAPFKCGPDYLDPTYHRRAAGRPSVNVDGWMMGREGSLATFARAAAEADIAVIEGVMGLFDGASPTGEAGSTAEMAKWLQAPVLAVIDAGGMARTVAALAHGLSTFDGDLRVGGLLCNRVGSKGHVELLRKACKVPPILGALPKAQENLRFSERHLGLHTARGDVVSDEVLQGWAALATEWMSLDAIVDLARSAPPLEIPEEGTLHASETKCRIGVALDDALHFYYDDNLARLQGAGAELVHFSLLSQKELPAVDGLYLGGGYPEVHAQALAANGAMRESLRAFANKGGPIYAECGGLMVLTDAIVTKDGRFPMAGILEGEVTMHDKLQALGYVEVETQEKTLLGPPGTRFRGHQFRYSDYAPGPGQEPRLYSVRRRRADDFIQEGYGRQQVVASYVHAHWASNPRIPQAFVDACVRFRQGQGAP
jgi:cobyrinic acid a,c-diamide synthase